MDDIRTDRLLLHAIDVAEGTRIVSRKAVPTDLWVDDFPFDGDVSAVTMFLTATTAFGEQRPFGYYRIDRMSDGRAVEGVGFKSKLVANCVEIGYGLAPSARGRGYAREAIVGMLEIARKFGVETVTADTARDNLSSQRSLIRAGFQLVSTDADSHHFRLGLD